ncbi:hypothetical protein MBLNU459_g6084t1 [Dothideomycetes sp. NU459]
MTFAPSRMPQKLTSVRIQSLLIFFAPIAIPRALAFYRSIRAPSTLPTQPLSPGASRALNVLFGSALICLISTLPYFAPANIFAQTSSRLQTPTNVLFTRLSALRPLAPLDKALQAVFDAGGLEARLLYLRFGPEVLSTCPIVTDAKAADSSMMYLFYATPTLLAPHLYHLGMLGLVTSTFFAGRHAARWRTAAIIAGLALLALDFGALATYDHGLNARAARPADVDAFFWKRRLVSRLLTCAADAALGWVVWLTATNRAFVEPAPAAEHLENSTRALEALLNKLRGLGAVRNVVFRDTMLRSKLERYWVQEQEVMREVFEDREVVSALNEVLGAVDMGRVENDANVYVNGVLGQEQNGGIVAG